jgi:preprotein translocase subunit SecG
MENLLIFIYILISVVLVLTVLLQQGKGSDIGSAFGAGSSNAMFGSSSSGSPLTKVTAVLSAAFLILSLTITWQSRDSGQGILFEDEQVEILEEGILPENTPEF